MFVFFSRGRNKIFFVLVSLKLKILKSTETIIDYQYCDMTRHKQPLKSGIIFTPLTVIINTV
jgi:hypothetical protein